MLWTLIAAAVSISIQSYLGAPPNADDLAEGRILLLFSFLLFPLAAVSHCTRLGEKSSAPDDVMMGTPSRDLTLQFLPNRLEKMLVAEELLRMDCGC